MSKQENNTKSKLITLSAREKDTLERHLVLAKEGILPENQTEIFRRGLHVAIRLAEVNETSLLEVLAEKLKKSTEKLEPKTIRETLAISEAIYAVLVAKRGVLGAESFEAIPLTLKQLEGINKTKADNAEIKRVLFDLLSGIETVFLRHQLNNLSIGGKAGNLRAKPLYPKK